MPKKKKHASPARKKVQAKRQNAKIPDVSLCMMVKNEEKRLPEALQSAQPFVDEIIVVDTGSTDRTVEIAESFGAKVYHHPWEDNFSKHRMQSIGHASGEWVLILDADEVLDQETAPNIKKVAAAAPPEVAGFLFDLYNAVLEGGDTMLLHPRLFRKGKISYRGKVHNRPFVEGKLVKAPVKMVHYGYAEDAATMEMKHTRRVEMIEKWVADEPDNFRAHSYLAHTLISQIETLTRGVEEAKTALELMRAEKVPAQEYPHAYYPLMNGLALSGRDAECLRHARDCLEMVPDYPDSLLFIAGVLYKQKKWEEVCATAERFLAAQARCRANPDQFIFFENMTYDQMNYVLFRWAVAAGALDRQDEALTAFELMFEQVSPEDNCRRVVVTVLSAGDVDLGLKMIDAAQKSNPGWAWPRNLELAAREKLRESRSADLKEQGLAALEAKDVLLAETLLSQAVEFSPMDAEILFSLSKALGTEGKNQEEEAWLMRGLNLSLHPQDPWPWRRLANACFNRGDYEEAQALYQRYLGQAPLDKAASARFATCQRRNRYTEPTVAAKPPTLLVFLVGGMTLEMILEAPPHFLMGRAWGLILNDDFQPPSLPNWATIMTGVEPVQHGCLGEGTRVGPISLEDLKVPTLWELMPAKVTLGLAAMPLGYPLPDLPGWSLAGHPAGALSPGMVNPSRLAYRALAAGYRSDVVLTDFEEEVFAQRLAEDFRLEAKLYQVERAKISAAMAMPAVDVLVIGVNLVEYLHQSFEMGGSSRDAEAVFRGYQQLFTLIETTLAAVAPQNYAVLSQRGYPHKEYKAQGGGMYCLSWLKGEKDRAARPTDLAPALLSLMGGDPARLGRPRGQREVA